MHKPMVDSGYPTSFSAGIITSTSAIGIIIPPSIPMIIYGASAETSIPRLYAAGVFPGLLLAVALAIYVIIRSRAGQFGTTERYSLRDMAHASGRAFWALGAPIIVLGGIYRSIFSPTEAAAVACVYAIVVTRFVFRELGWRDILQSAMATVLFTGQILVIAAAAGLFSWLLTVNQIPMNLVTWIASLDINAWQFLLAVNLILLLWGCFMDPLSAILLLTPLLMPLVDVFGIDRVHFGIVMTLNLAIGLFTPPFGINIFVAQSVLGMKISDIYRGIIPFLFVFLCVLIAVTFFPQISLSSANFFLAK
jgi:C4-dicarboxylate transporter, DctM subunit